MARGKTIMKVVMMASLGLESWVLSYYQVFFTYISSIHPSCEWMLPFGVIGLYPL